MALSPIVDKDLSLHINKPIIRKNSKIGNIDYQKILSTVLRVTLVVLCLYVLISAVNILSSALAFQTIPEALTASLSSPIVAVAAGMLLTVLLQSSSASTAITIALTASGAIDLQTAVFLVLGANIGTTMTNSFVSLGYIKDKEKFASTFSAGTVHDFFNFITVSGFFFLEYFTSALSLSASYLANILYATGDSENTGNIVITGFISVSDWVASLFKYPAELLSENNVNTIVMIVLGIVMILLSIALLSKVLASSGKNDYSLESHSDSQLKLTERRFGSILFDIKGIFSGAAATALVQSSSVTTSAAVAGIGSGRLTMKSMYPFIAGANIGTTLTAFLVAYMTGSELALALALSHMLFNVASVLIVFSVPILKPLPVKCSELMYKIVSKGRIFAGVYLGLFVLTPVAVLAIAGIFG